MRINNNTSLYAQRAQSQATNPNFVYKTRNSQGVTGMEITGMNASDFKTISVSTDIKEKLINTAQNVFLENNGVNDGEKMSKLIREYTASLPEKDRIHASWTLGQIWTDEYKRIEDTVKASIPGWNTGQSFDYNLVKDLISKTGYDQKI